MLSGHSMQGTLAFETPDGKVDQVVDATMFLALLESLREAPRSERAGHPDGGPKAIFGLEPSRLRTPDRLPARATAERSLAFDEQCTRGCQVRWGGM